MGEKIIMQIGNLTKVTNETLAKEVQETNPFTVEFKNDKSNSRIFTDVDIKAMSKIDFITKIKLLFCKKKQFIDTIENYISTYKQLNGKYYFIDISPIKKTE